MIGHLFDIVLPTISINTKVEVWIHQSASAVNCSETPNVLRT